MEERTFEFIDFPPNIFPREIYKWGPVKIHPSAIPSLIREGRYVAAGTEEYGQQYWVTTYQEGTPYVDLTEVAASGGIKSKVPCNTKISQYGLIMCRGCN